MKIFYRIDAYNFIRKEMRCIFLTDITLSARVRKYLTLYVKR